MLRLRVHVVPWTVLCCLAAVGLAGEPAREGGGPETGAGGRRVTKYTKEWTDDYHNRNRVVYSAYTRAIRDEKGTEFTVEVWHGRATGYHENGQKAWEGEYRDGKREGPFTTWAANGTRTGLSQVEGGLVHGTSTQWAADGRKIREETYQRGKLHGEARWWAPDGKLATTGTYREGVPWDGTFVELDPSPPRSRWVMRRYERGQKVGQEDVPGGSANWW